MLDEKTFYGLQYKYQVHLNCVLMEQEAETTLILSLSSMTRRQLKPTVKIYICTHTPLKMSRFHLPTHFCSVPVSWAAGPQAHLCSEQNKWEKSSKRMRGKACRR